MQDKKTDIDLSLSFELTEGDKLIFNQTPKNTLLEDMETVRHEFSTSGILFLDEEEEVETDRFFRDSGELAKFIGRINGKYNNHPSLYTVYIYMNFRKFERVNRSKYGRGVWPATRSS